MIAVEEPSVMIVLGSYNPGNILQKCPSLAEYTCITRRSICDSSLDHQMKDLFMTITLTKSIIDHDKFLLTTNLIMTAVSKSTVNSSIS